MRIQLLNVDGAKFIGFAKNKLAQLIQLRRDLKTSFLSRWFFVANAKIYIQAMEFNDLIRITAVGGANILFAGVDQAGVFSWTENRVTLKNAQLGIDWIRNSRPDSIYTSNGYNVAAADTFSTAQSLIAQQPIAYLPEYQLPLWFDESNLQTVSAGEIITLATVSMLGASISEASITASGDFVYFPRQYSSSWNLFEPVDHVAFNPATRAIWSSGHWVPSLFYVLPGSLFYSPGWYYGKELDWLESSADGSGLTQVEVLFGAYLECRDFDANVKYGYCEILTQLEDEEKFLLSFFLSATPMTHPGNPSEVYLSMTGTKYGGTTPGGFSRTDSLDLYTFFGKPLSQPEVHFWGFNSFAQETFMTTDVDAFGIVVAVDNKAIGYRYKGYYREIFRTENYHSHSVSHDGNIMALFEGVGLIETVSVWDMFNPDAIELCSQFVVNEGLFSLGEIIPVTLNSVKALPYDLFTVTAVDSGTLENPSKWYAPYAVIQYPDRGSGTVVINKLYCDGVRAWIQRHVDDCMQSEIVQYRASSSTDTVSFTVDDVSFTGPFYEAAASLPKVLFRSVASAGGPNEIVFAKFVEDEERGLLVRDACNSASGVSKNIRTLNDQLTVGRALPIGNLVVSGALGDIIYGGCFTEDGEEDDACIALAHCADSDVEFSAITSCGQEGSLIEPYDLEVLTIIGEDNCFLFSTYSGSGGVPPYEYSVSQGIINETTGEVTNIDGACGTGTLIVTDSCGTTAEKHLRFPVGQWEYTSEEGHFPIDAPCRQTENYSSYAGNRRTYHWYAATPNDCCNWYGSGCRAAYDGSYDGTYPIWVCCRDWGPCNWDQIPKIYVGGSECRIRLTGRKFYTWVCP